MLIDKRIATRLKKTLLSILITFILLLVLESAGFAQEKVKPSGTDTQAQQITIEKHIAELETKLKSVKEQIDKITQPGSGAVAIGVGFGSQNLINNFISGFIIMFERPIKIDDVIEIDNIIGTVQHIGTRCTQIRTQANLNILVPNSSLLERNIINWTLSDDVVRCNVSVGVAYGSSTRDTVKALERAVEEHALILKKPEPIIVFKDFGDNALVFEVFFWIWLGKGRLVKMQTESNVRFLIEKHLREAEIVVAFPQRDVHMDTSKPLDLRIITGDKDDLPDAER